MPRTRPPAAGSFDTGAWCRPARDSSCAPCSAWWPTRRREAPEHVPLRSDLLANVEALAATLDGGLEAIEVRLEAAEDAVGEILRSQPDLALARAGILEDLLGASRGQLLDLLGVDDACALLARRLDDPRGL